MKLNRIESILATAIFIFILIFMYSNGIHHEGRHTVFALMAYTTVIYGTFMVFTQWISPTFFQPRKIEGGIAFTLLLFFLVWLGLTTSIWVRDYHHWGEGQFVIHLKRGESLGGALLVFLLLFAYEGIKRLIRYLQQTQNTLATRIAKESLVVLGAGALIAPMLFAVSGSLAAFWVSVVPYVYVIYAMNMYWLLPLKEKRKHTFLLYIAIAIGISFVAFIPFGLFFLSVIRSDEEVYFVIWICINLIMLPLANFVYQRQRERITQLVNLKMELGQTSADLSFLRSQINPHFLFNILNTLYGTALQEDAERAATGIQKLGDMMRFMLHENNQDSILLAREIDYLRNYIDLQLLRTATTTGITVECDINDALEGTYIAPMLLIPFVENAFKHGISLQEKSWIKISLYESEGKLYFDVHNSIHRKPKSDPEGRHSGIGLENVKQRLAMLYPDRHDLVIRETTQEFFVHLTVIS
ncbi:sensor histidine kinase [Parapedobacter tibetensis]|uniref:sensor histidine kinase n=1 Tax=Parapedobacter tibetensis TaxID=2972951 RepID=UPI00214DB02D|nr:histidine kinase [Parapedobacter tibetensis]